ncbi:MAG: hypothetical protein U0163_09265 [Gemmatimonadaceae bacterium]
MSLVLLVSASLFLRNLRAATTVDKGFDSSNLVLATVRTALQGYDRARTDAFYQQLVARVEAIRTLKAVGLADQVPLGLGSSDTGVEIPRYTPAPNENMSIYYASTARGTSRQWGSRSCGAGALRSRMARATGADRERALRAAVLQGR